MLEQPKQSGSHYRNYKGTDRIILIAVVGSEYEFLFADVGMNGCKSDGGNWSRSPMKKALEENSHDLPKATPLTTTLMKPFPQSNLKMEKRGHRDPNRYLKMHLEYLQIAGAYPDDHLTLNQKI